MARKAIKYSVSIIFLLFLSITFICGQEKVEKEYKVDEEEVPGIAIVWVNQTFPNSKIKWFYEETSGKKSYEAKLEWDDRDHSIEFDTNGILEDVEIKVSWKSLSEDTKQQLSEVLHKEDENYKIRKIQLQLSGDNALIKGYIRGNIDAEILIRYEIEYYSTSNDKFNLWEGLFSQEGEMISKRKVKMLTTDNLDF